MTFWFRGHLLQKSFHLTQVCKISTILRPCTLCHFPPPASSLTAPPFPCFPISTLACLLSLKYILQFCLRTLILVARLLGFFQASVPKLSSVHIVLEVHTTHQAAHLAPPTGRLSTATVCFLYNNLQ